MIVLASAMLVTTIGLASLFAIRVQRRSAQTVLDNEEARLAALSAVELGLLLVTSDPNWRTTCTNGTWIENKQAGNARLSLTGTDPQDGDLADSEYEPLVLTGIGTKGISRHMSQVTLVPVVRPMEALNTCLHTAQLLKVKAGDLIVAVGAPISTNGMLDNDEMIDGDAEAGSIDSMVTITGTLTAPAPAKTLPGPDVFTRYKSRATVIPAITKIDKQVLTPTANPWGPADPNGVYFIDTGANDLTITNSRICGTLVVQTGSAKKVLIDGAIFLKNYRSDCPVLITNGNLEIKNNSLDYPLSEAGCGVNFNPVGAPYEGSSDSDMLDEYPNEIRGLIHAMGSVALFDNARIVGTILCDGPATIDGKNTIIHDSTLYTSPPNGYSFVERMTISPGSWRQVVD